MLSYANVYVVSDKCFDIASKLGSAVAATLGPDYQQDKEKLGEWGIRCIVAISKNPYWRSVTCEDPMSTI